MTSEVVTAGDGVRRVPTARRVRTLMPAILFAAMFVAFFVLPALTGREATTFSLQNAMQNWAAVGLLALGVGVTMIAGEFDLGALGIYTASGMIAVKVGESGALLGLVAAVAAGGLIGATQGLIIARLRINSMPVTLGFYIALLGTTLAISKSKSVSFSNLDVGFTLDATKLGVLSWRSIVAIVVFAAVAAGLRFTRLGRDVRAVGGDRRASRIVGVQVDRVLVTVFVVSGLCAAIGGSLLAYSLATAAPDPGIAPLTFAVTAALIGGVSLVGGVGAAGGIALGSVTLSLLQELFSVLAAPDYVAAIVTGGLLVVATIVAAPDLIARWHALRAPGARPVEDELTQGRGAAAPEDVAPTS